MSDDFITLEEMSDTYVTTDGRTVKLCIIAH